MRPLGHWALLVIAPAIFTAGAIAYLLGVQDHNIHALISTETDALTQLNYVQPYLDGSTPFSIDRIGAPLGYNAYSHPVCSHITYMLAALLSFIGGGTGIGLNLTWIIKSCLAASAASMTLNCLGARPSFSIAFGSLYGLTPYTFARNVDHLNLGTWFIPFLVLPALLIAQDRYSSMHWKLKATIVAPIVLAGFDDVYTVYFALVLYTASIIAYALTGCRRKTVAFLILCSILASATVINHIPGVLAMLNAPSESVAGRSGAAVNPNSLRIRDLFLPVPHHPVRSFRETTERIDREVPVQANRSHYSHIGLFGTMGFCLLLASILARSINLKTTLNQNHISTIIPAAAYTLILILLSTMGSVSNFIVQWFPFIVAYERTTPYIAFFSLLPLSIAGSQLFDAMKRSSAVRLVLPLELLTVLAIVGIGAWDQFAVRDFSHIWKESNKTRDELSRFLQSAATYLPPKASIYQPSRLIPPKNAYKLPYMIPNTFNWSYVELPSIQITRWNEWIQRNPETEVAKVLWSGFSGVWLDARGIDPQQLRAAEMRFLGIEGATILASNSNRFKLIILGNTNLTNGEALPVKQAIIKAFSSPNVLTSPLTLAQVAEQFPTNIADSGLYFVVDNNEDWSAWAFTQELLKASTIIATTPDFRIYNLQSANFNEQMQDILSANLLSENVMEDDFESGRSPILVPSGDNNPDEDVTYLEHRDGLLGSKAQLVRREHASGNNLLIRWAIPIESGRYLFRFRYRWVRGTPPDFLIGNTSTGKIRKVPLSSDQSSIVAVELSNDEELPVGIMWRYYENGAILLDKPELYIIESNLN